MGPHTYGDEAQKIRFPRLTDASAKDITPAPTQRPLRPGMFCKTPWIFQSGGRRLGKRPIFHNNSDWADRRNYTKRRDGACRGKNAYYEIPKNHIAEGGNKKRRNRAKIEALAVEGQQARWEGGGRWAEDRGRELLRSNMSKMRTRATPARLTDAVLKAQTHTAHTPSRSPNRTRQRSD